MTAAVPHERDFLELLAREATLVEFERPLVDARSAGLSGAALVEVEQAKLLALRVRALLERRRRREEELSALYDTAGDLAGLRDVDAVLRAIVHRARTLLNVDVSYMTLNDSERGDTYMRVTDGSVAASFQRLRLEPGAGLGGLVALTGAPYATANYPTDSRFKHKADIDHGVTEEGLVAILGVPMRLGSSVIGVLFAADRAERPFARDEVDLLQSLAAHAAVALDTARLLSETQAALAELSAANAVIRAHSESVERAAAAHDRMTAVVLRGGQVDEVAADLVDVLHGTLLVIDAQGRTLATASTPGYAADLPQPAATLVEEAVAASRGRGGTVRRDELAIAAVVAGADDLGALVLHPAHPLTDADERILERGAQVTALLLLFRRTVAEAEAQVRGDLLDDLISRPVRDPQAVRTRAGRLGLDIDAPYVVVTAGDHNGEGLGQRAISWARTFAAARQGLAVAREGRIVLLLPGEDAAAAARLVSRDLGRTLSRSVTAGGAGPARRPDAVASTSLESGQCLSALVALGRGGSGGGTTELGYVGLLLGERRDVAAFVHGVVGPVIDYDTRRGTALVRTLEAYFEAGGGLTKAAEALHVHVNTVTQRLERIARLLGDDWHQPGRVLDLQLALRLHNLRG
ncbi:transcriptional regulator, CdaR family [Actinoplanes regularis]|uniref:Transcriptional regulator, CdaR family n=1 Tax=Actinoplanes regularis TaxID=52697 RepID=A0A238YUF7_9ACTN|nr:cyclic diguanylate phosphodiesterase [Actinoplanes regularis]SNR74274.1 transcriptional regulator, CdaR family [Actinoplanes regularis]